MAKVKVELAHPQEWSRFLGALCKLNAAVQSDELVISVTPYASAEVHETASNLKKLVDEVCPEVLEDAYAIAEFLKNNEQGFIPDPKESMSLAWNTYAEEAIPRFDEAIKSNDRLARAVANFWNNIGEAMGPVCYTGFQLKEALDRYMLPRDWVDECIRYYEENWKF